MFFPSKYIALLEKQIAELQAEKVELKVENARLQRLLIPGMRVAEKQEQPRIVPVKVELQKQTPTTLDGKKLVPAVKGWLQARDQAERLTEETERKEA